MLLGLVIFFNVLYQQDIRVTLIFYGSVFFTFLLLRQVKKALDYLNPLTLFLIISFLAFQLKFYVYYLNPSKMYFTNSPINFYYDESDFHFTFLYFILGYFSFILGYSRFGNKNQPSTSILRKISGHTGRIPRLSTLMAINIIFLILSSILMYKFQIGLLFGEAPVLGFKIVGIIYYFFVYGSHFLFLLYIYASFRNKNYFHIFFSLSLLFTTTFIGASSYSKAGFLVAFLILLSIILSLKQFHKKIPNVIYISALLSLGFFIALYPLIQLYRFAGLGMDISRGISSLPLLFAVAKDIEVSISQVFWDIFSRVSGFGSLLSIVAYEKDAELLNVSDFFQYFLGNESSDYALFYRINIMGVLHETGFELTLWGFLYIYFGVYGIVLGMFLWGKLNRFLFRIIREIYCTNYVYGMTLLFLYLIWFLGITFGFGPNTPWMALKVFVATIFLFVFWTKVFSFTPKLRYG